MNFKLTQRHLWCACVCLQQTGYNCWNTSKHENNFKPWLQFTWLREITITTSGNYIFEYTISILTLNHSSRTLLFPFWRNAQDDTDWLMSTGTCKLKEIYFSFENSQRHEQRRVLLALYAFWSMPSVNDRVVR